MIPLEVLKVAWAGLNSRIGRYAMLLILLAGCYLYASHWYSSQLRSSYNSGYQTAVNEMKLKEQAKEAADRAKVQVVQDQVQTQIQTITKVVTKVIHDIPNVKSSCTDIGDDAVSVLNGTISAGNSALSVPKP